MAEGRTDAIVWEKLYREIKTEKPIITLYDVVWDQNANIPLPGNINKNQFDSIDLLSEHNEGEEQAERDSTMLKLNQVGESGKESTHSKLV